LCATVGMPQAREADADYRRQTKDAKREPRRLLRVDDMEMAHCYTVLRGVWHTGSGTATVARCPGARGRRRGPAASRWDAVADRPTCRAGSGDLRLGSVRADLAGPCRLRRPDHRGRRGRRLDLTTGSGNVRLGVHAGVAAELDLRSGSGKVRQRAGRQRQRAQRAARHPAARPRAHRERDVLGDRALLVRRKDRRQHTPRCNAARAAELDAARSRTPGADGADRRARRGEEEGSPAESPAPGERGDQIAPLADHHVLQVEPAGHQPQLGGDSAATLGHVNTRLTDATGTRSTGPPDPSFRSTGRPGHRRETKTSSRASFSV